jgi:16S rRNA (cytosine1402-N4)-methyltransferase
MLEEVIAALAPRSGEIAADCTLGWGGHAEALLERLGPKGQLIGLDLDGEQLERTRRRLTAGRDAASGGGQLSFHRCHFAGLGKVLRTLGLEGVDMILADLGVSSMQVDDPSRGFSYKFDGPLDMRMDNRHPRTAAQLLATMSEVELSSALADLADEPDHAVIARGIVRHREHSALETTQQLVQLVFRVKNLSRRQWRNRVEASVSGGTPERSARETHPAARTFQALRILVNDELNGVSQFLRGVPYCLRPGGRVAVISFHSGEDRIVKRAFREGISSGLYAAIGERVVRPGTEEVRNNPRAASARLRWARTHGGGD